jgi:hypothetical protein
LWIEEEGWSTSQSKRRGQTKTTASATTRGGVQLTNRDVETIGWIAEQYAVRTDVIRWLLGADKPLSESRTRAVVARWVRAGLVESRRFFAGAPHVVWPTRQGVRLSGSTWRTRTPTVALLRHHHAVSVVRLGVERRGYGTSWVCERMLFKQRANDRAHVPDGVFRTSREVETAVEVELTVKGADRLRGIIRDLAFDYESVLYVVGDAKVGAAVDAAVRAEGETDKVRVISLDRVQLTEGAV